MLDSMLDSIGSQINRLPSFVIVIIMVVALITFLALNFEKPLANSLKVLIRQLKLTVPKPKQSEQTLSSKQIEELGNSLVGKFMTEDLLDGQEVIASKGTLISEHIAFEAEKRGLLQKLDSISVFWPIES